MSASVLWQYKRGELERQHHKWSAVGCGGEYMAFTALTRADQNYFQHGMGCWGCFVLCEGLCWWDTAALWGHPATAPICSQMWGWWSPFCAALSKAGLQQHLKHHSPWRSEGSCGCFALISFGGLIFAVSLAPTSAAPGLTADGCSAQICRCSREQIINHPAMATRTWGFGLFFNPEKLQVQTCTFC